MHIRNVINRGTLRPNKTDEHGPLIIQELLIFIPPPRRPHGGLARVHTILTYLPLIWTRSAAVARFIALISRACSPNTKSRVNTEAQSCSWLIQTRHK